MKSPLLSVMMIVKNEARRLPGCLQALKPLSDSIAELVITDTGSTDETPSIAFNAGAKVQFFPWNGNESDARNISLRASTGNWVFWVDADETVSAELAEDLILRLPLIQAKNGIQSGSVIMENRYQGGAGTSLTRLLRLARRREDLAFTGAIHPQLNFQQEVVDFSGKLFHDGYAWTPEERQRKARHMRSHLEPLCKAEKPPLNRWCELLSALLIGDDVEAFKEQWNKISLYSDEERLSGPLAHYWSENCANFFQHFARQNDFASMAHHAKALRTHQPDHAGATFYLLQSSILQKNWQETLEYSDDLLKISAQPPGFYNTVYKERQIDPAKVWNWMAHRMLNHGSNELPKDLPLDRVPQTLLYVHKNATGGLYSSNPAFNSLLKIYSVWTEKPNPTLMAAAEKNGLEVVDTFESPGIHLLARLLLASVYSSTHRTTEALHQLNRALELHPDTSWLATLLNHYTPEKPLPLSTLSEKYLHLT